MSEEKEKEQPKFGPLAPLEFGSANFVLKDQSMAPSKYDRLAYGNRSQVLIIGLVDYGNKIRAIRALLNSSQGRVTIECNGGRTCKPSEVNGYPGPRNPGRLTAGNDGYRLYVNKLDYGLVHALFVSKEEGFMPVMTPEALWEELNDTRFTTPIIREWVPHLETKLRAKSLLEEAWCFRCNAGWLSATSAQLDQIVSAGLQTGEIAIPEPAGMQPIDVPQIECGV
jgi:hypothetical protein